MESEVTRYWLVRDIPYALAYEIAVDPLIECVTRDTRENSARYWPGTEGVKNYLLSKIPEGATISDDSEEKPVKKVKAPVIVHKSMGMDID